MDVLKKYALFHIHTFTKYCCGSEPLLVLFFVCRIIIKSFQMSSERWRLWWQAYKVSPDCALSLSSAVPFSCFSSLFGRLHNLGLIKGALWKLVGDLASFFFFFTFYIVYTARSQCHFFFATSAKYETNQASVCLSHSTSHPDCSKTVIYICFYSTKTSSF